jgi:hypothetical protein
MKKNTVLLSLIVIPVVATTFYVKNLNNLNQNPTTLVVNQSQKILNQAKDSSGIDKLLINSTKGTENNSTENKFTNSTEIYFNPSKIQLDYYSQNLTSINSDLSYFSLLNDEEASKQIPDYYDILPVFNCGESYEINKNYLLIISEKAEILGKCVTFIKETVINGENSWVTVIYFLDGKLNVMLSKPNFIEPKVIQSLDIEKDPTDYSVKNNILSYMVNSVDENGLNTKIEKTITLK